MNENIKYLIKTTVDICQENGIDDLSDIAFSEKQESVWSIICFRHFKNYDIKNLTNIYSWWDCNYLDYAVNVKKELSNDKNNEISFQIVLSNEEWRKVLPTISGLRSRRRFNRNFDKIINEKFVKIKETNCILKSKYNSFKKNGSQKKDSNFWTGKYECINVDCCLFKALICKEPLSFEDVSINFTFIRNKIEHGPLANKQDIRGAEKKLIALTSITDGSDVLRSKMLLEKNQNVKGIKIHILYCNALLVVAFFFNTITLK
ncbi:unnamed protein product [Brachionus calyciflorus]|uniref:Uncharacterized protein n=1 Tax=Brachionus calyciflorus TaxID=104777 RepID=A0A813ZEJ9_9BILA|nr:unnamed protein product [Brachionus calyciflorus]